MVLLCCTVSGAVDTIVMSLWGMEGKALGHGVGCVVLGFTGWRLLDRERKAWGGEASADRGLR